MMTSYKSNTKVLINKMFDFSTMRNIHGNMGRAIAASCFVYYSFDAFLAAALHLIAGYIFLGIWPMMGIWGVEKFKLQPAPIFLL